MPRAVLHSHLYTQEIFCPGTHQHNANTAETMAAALKKPETWSGCEEESGNDPNGESANTGPGAPIASGFGGLGLEGIVGNEESLGESTEPPGEGNRGVMSGDNAGGEANGESGNNAGAAEIVEVWNCGSSAKLVDTASIKDGIDIEIINNIKSGHIEAINDEEISAGTEINVIFWEIQKENVCAIIEWEKWNECTQEEGIEKEAQCVEVGGGGRNGRWQMMIGASSEHTACNA